MRSSKRQAHLSSGAANADIKRLPASKANDTQKVVALRLGSLVKRVNALQKCA